MRKDLCGRVCVEASMQRDLCGRVCVKGVVCKGLCARQHEAAFSFPLFSFALHFPLLVYEGGLDCNYSLGPGYRGLGLCMVD